MAQAPHCGFSAPASPQTPSLTLSPDTTNPARRELTTAINRARAATQLLLWGGLCALPHGACPDASLPISLPVAPTPRPTRAPEESPLMTRAVDPLALDLLNCHLYNQLLSPE